MNEPIYQAWRKIKPVEGEPIPDGAMYKRSTFFNWKEPARTLFCDEYMNYAWRVPMPVIPEDVAADLIQRIARNGFVDTFRVYPSDAVPAEQLRELVTANLRALSQEAV